MLRAVSSQTTTMRMMRTWTMMGMRKRTGKRESMWTRMRTMEATITSEEELCVATNGRSFISGSLPTHALIMLSYI